jgi:hypothetical protein
MSQDPLMVDSQSLREWLRTRRQINHLHLTLMTLRYDLDGAMDAQQPTLAWRSQAELLCTGVHLFLARSGVAVPAGHQDDRVDGACRVMAALERVHPELSDQAWHLLLRPIPPHEQLAGEIERTLAFAATRLGMPWVASRRDTVVQWAADTRLLRSVAKRFGIAQSDDWYLSADGTSAPGTDWYDEVIASLEQEVSA